VMLTMRRKKMLKRNSLRHAEYYNMVEIQDRLFQESKDGMRGGSVQKL